MAALRRKHLTTALKVVISGVLLYFVFTKIEPDKTLRLLSQAEPWAVLVALVFFLISKFIAAFRLNYYFRAIGAGLTERSNIKLYLLGMFYNLFLPGGIGGDAYKGYLIKKRFGIPLKKVVSALLIDRLSGLLLLFLYACILAFFVTDPVVREFGWVIVVAGIAAPLVFLALQKKLFPTIVGVYWKTFFLSAAVQLAQLLCVLFIMRSLGIHEATATYLFIFLISSIVAVLPLTIGGIGSREVVFYYGAMLYGLTEKVSVSISLMFFLITAIVSLAGIIYHFRKPELTGQGNSGQVN